MGTKEINKEIIAADKPSLEEDEFIEVWGAREHNLKDVDLKIPREKLVVITGVSGSGKSSLAFDTIHAEGQRRYLESFSAYARQFIGDLKAPDVDKIDGLSPVIAIEQKTTSKNPRSTVGTVTEVYDLFRLLFARAGEAYSYSSGKRMVRFSDDEIIQAVSKQFEGKKIIILAALVKGRKGHYKELFESLRKQGYTKVRINGEIVEISHRIKLDRYKIHDIELVIDRMVGGTEPERLTKSVNLALSTGEGSMMVIESDIGKVFWFSRDLMDPETGLSYDEPSPNTFSFNSPYGSCPVCHGLGYVNEVDETALVPDPTKSINNGALAPAGEVRDVWIFHQLRKVADAYGFSLAIPWNKIPEEAREFILEGHSENIPPKLLKGGFNFKGVKQFVENWYLDSSSEKIRQWAEDFMRLNVCPECLGTRLKKESLWFFLDGKNISDVARLDLAALYKWLTELPKKMNERQNVIAQEVLKEISRRLEFMLEVGLEYLVLDRPARTLSGGEAQRIRLATQIGSQLMGVLYILDEPSIGLHQRDNAKLIDSLKKLRDIGNSVIVVEHDKDMMLASDFLVDFGPGAGVHGGRIIAQGSPEEVLKTSCPTSDYLSGRKKISIRETRRKPGEKYLSLKGATGNNLKNIDLNIPLGLLVCITGVSGSGKSTLISETLYPALNKHFFDSRQKPLGYSSLEGIEEIDKVIEIDQSPIGRTPRSNPATYTGVFTFIRDFFTQLPEAKIRGYKQGRFSFNVKGGRCEECEGAGLRTIEMNFLPDVFVECDVCQGRRYNRETLEVRYKGKSISDVLNLTISDALQFFDAHPRIHQKLKTIEDVGLGYITLGQQATTLSGGEAQRVKIATELSKRDTGRTLYILDEPTTGLHFQDIDLLLKVLDRLVERGNTVVVIEHNLDVIKSADWVIDLGPEGGEGGGTIVAQGTPEKIAKVKESWTGRFLAKEI